MSKVAIKGNASGTGTFTLEAPNSNTDRTLVLPDEAGTVLTSASSISASVITGLTQGITEAVQYRKVTSEDVGLSLVTITNWEVVDTDGAGKVGTGVTESSGVFSFASTGIWLIMLNTYWSASGTATWADNNLETSVDGTNYNTASRFVQGASSGYYGTGTCSFMFDVEDTDLCKIKYTAQCNTGPINIKGNTSLNTTTLTFIRLGDT